MSYRIELRNGTAAEWASSNPVLGLGEVGIVTDAVASNPNAKLGDGSTAWSSLGWWNPGGLAGLAPSGDGTGVKDQANVQALINLGVTDVMLQAGQFYGNTAVIAADKNVYVTGSGIAATQWNFTGTGDAFRFYGTSILLNPKSGGILGMTIDGTSAGAGSCGLHYGDMHAFEMDCAVQNFSGAGSYGAHLDNQYYWTEETRGYLLLTNNTQNLVFDVSQPAGGSYTATNASPCVFTCASPTFVNGTQVVLSGGTAPTGFTNGTAYFVVSASGTTFRLSATSGGSAINSSSTGNGTITQATSTNSFGYSDLKTEIIARIGQDGIVFNNGATLYNGDLSLKANFQGSSSPQSNAVLRITGSMPAGHTVGSYSQVHSVNLDVMAECNPASVGGGTNAPYTIYFGTLSSNNLLGCRGILDFAQGTVPFQVSNWTATGSTGFQFDGVIRGDFNLNNATVGIGATYSFATQGVKSFGKALLNVSNGNVQMDNGDFFSSTLTGNITINLNPGGAATLGSAQRKVVIIKQAASGGPYTVTWPSTGSPTTTNCTVIWPGGVAPVMSTAASAVDVYYLDTYDGATWYGRSWWNPGLTGLAPSGDSTGVKDPANIQALLNLGAKATLQSGTFYIGGSSALSMATANSMLTGSGLGTQLQILSGFSAAEVISVGAASCIVRDLAIVGASSTLTSNPACNGIELNGFAHCRFENIWGQYVNGWLIESVGGSSTPNLDTMISKIVARNCAAGVHVKGVTGSSFQAEHFLTDIQIQQCGAASGANANLDGLLIEDANDVLVEGVNIGMASGTTGGALHIKGACATVAVTNPDVGANATSGSKAALFIESSSNGSPSGVTINGGSVEGGSSAIRVDAGSDVTFNGVRGHQAYGDGLQVTLSDGDVLAIGCSFAANNQNGGTAYDIDCGSMTGGNFRAVGCRLETAIGTSTPGEVPNSVSASTHAYFKSCFFIATGSSPSNVFTGTPQQVTECVGYNPRGTVTATSIGTSPFTPGGYQTPLMVIFTAINGMTEFDIGGTAVPLPVAGVPYVIGVRESMTITWTTTKPTWQWFGL